MMSILNNLEVPKCIDFKVDSKAVVGGPAMAGPLFLAENGLGRTTIFDFSGRKCVSLFDFLTSDGPVLVIN